MARLLTFLASAPERLVRSIAALLGGGIHETASLALPRFVRRSRLYEATAKNMLAALEGTWGKAARLIDIPPIALQELRLSLTELREGADELPSRQELARAYRGLLREAEAERGSLLVVGTGMALAFALSARNVGRAHVTAPYREDWRPLRDEGFAAYARRIAGPYREAIAAHLDPARSTFTERGLERLRRGQG